MVRPESVIKKNQKSQLEKSKSKKITLKSQKRSPKKINHRPQLEKVKKQSKSQKSRKQNKQVKTVPPRLGGLLESIKVKKKTNRKKSQP